KNHAFPVPSMIKTRGEFWHETVTCDSVAHLLVDFSDKVLRECRTPGAETHACHARIARRANLPQVRGIAENRNRSDISAIPPRQEGRTRRHERGAGCDGRLLYRLTSDVAGGRRRLVVLAPLGWCQVSRETREATVTKRSWTPGRARGYAVNTIAQGRPD